MRITGGAVGGIRIKVPRGGVRPTQERVREALFSMLAGRVAGGQFLDLFAGSGAVGLEAWSRGARRVVLVEKANSVARVLRANMTTLKTDDAVSVLVGDAEAVIRKGLVTGPFDIIFADPPYARRGGPDWPGRIMACLADAGVVAQDGVLVMEQGAEEDVPSDARWRLIDDRKYGDARLRFFVPDAGQQVAGAP